MFTILIISVIISLSVAAPVLDEPEPKILYYNNDIDAEGNYVFSFATSNGISRKESGKLVNVGEPNEHIQVEGEYSYTDAEGKHVVVEYTADENGYHVGEKELPLPPTFGAPLPPAVVAALLG